MTILFLNYDAKGYPDRNIFAPPLKFAIFANMMDNNLETLTHIGINSNYLSNYFNHTLGITFHTWLHTLRIQEAKRIISADPSIKISAVAASVGIPDRHCRLDRQSQKAYLYIRKTIGYGAEGICVFYDEWE